MADRLAQGVYAAVCAVFGLPSLVIGGGTAAIGMLTSALSVTLLGEPLNVYDTAVFLWGFAGLAGMAGWGWLSGVWFFGGGARLRSASAVWWWLLGGGMLAALVMATAGVAWAVRQNQPVWVIVVAGPTLLVPAAMLVWLRVRRPRSTADALESGRGDSQGNGSGPPAVR